MKLKNIKINKKLMKAIRLIISPFLFVIVFCYTFVKSFKITCEFVSYGGELRIATEDNIKEVANDEYLPNEKKYNNF